MKHDEYLIESERISRLSKEEKISFYQVLLDKEDKNYTRIHASFDYARLHYYDGDFLRVIDILEPIIVDYLSYPYVKELMRCFNLLGTALHCETLYEQSLFVYELALKIVEEKEDVFFYSYECSNIASVYFDLGEYERSKDYLKIAEEYLPYSHESMAAFVYMNQCITYQKLNCLSEALKVLEIATKKCDAEKYIRFDTLRTALTLYYKLNKRKEYEECKKELLDHMDEMNAAEFMDVCKNLYECGKEDGDNELVDRVFSSMNCYIKDFPKEIRVGLTVANLKYDHAKYIDDKDALLDALEMKNTYKDFILSSSSHNEVKTMSRVIGINEQLQEAIKSKEKAADAKSQFLSNMSHDIRTPLNGIVGLLKVCETRFDDIDVIKENHQKMKIVSEHLMSLINDVLDMSKIEDGSVTLAREVVHFNQMSKEILIIIDNLASDNQIQLNFDIDDNCEYPAVYGSPTHLKQIFLNIYSNCIKYNRPGGSITTSVSSRNIDATRCAYRWTITDTGIGMSKDFLEHVYEPFRQENNVARGSYKGTGLGMAIVKGLIELMNGTISIESEVNVGSKFVIEIPFEKVKDSLSAKNDAQLINSSIEGMKILLVEDNELNAEIACTLLKDEKASVTLAENGKLALDMFKNNPPGTYDVILMDIMMPVMDGLTATRQIRQLDREDAKIFPIIAMSANVYQEDINKCFDAGMNAHVGKPIDVEKIKQTIYRLVKC